MVVLLKIYLKGENKMSKYAGLLKSVQGTRGISEDVTTKQFANRASALKKDGFLEFEYTYLAAHKINTYTVKQARADRRIRFIQGIDAGLSDKEYESLIKKEYRKKGWIFNDGSFNPYKMIDYYQRIYNTPDTPQPKRAAKAIKDYHKALKATKESDARRKNVN